MPQQGLDGQMFSTNDDEYSYRPSYGKKPQRKQNTRYSQKKYRKGPKATEPLGQKETLHLNKLLDEIQFRYKAKKGRKHHETGLEDGRKGPVKIKNNAFHKLFQKYS